MARLFIHWIINALALLALTRIVAGVEVTSLYTALVAALVLGLLNALVRPVLILLTLPVSIVTLGLFTFVINALLVWFASTVVKGFSVDGFLPALMVALILWAVSTIAGWMLHANHRS